MRGRAWSMHEPNASVVTRCAVQDELAKVVGCRAPASQSGAPKEHKMTAASAMSVKWGVGRRAA